MNRNDWCFETIELVFRRLLCLPLESGLDSVRLHGSTAVVVSFFVLASGVSASARHHVDWMRVVLWIFRESGLCSADTLVVHVFSLPRLVRYGYAYACSIGEYNWTWTHIYVVSVIQKSCRPNTVVTEAAFFSG